MKSQMLSGLACVWLLALFASTFPLGLLAADVQALEQQGAAVNAPMMNPGKALVPDSDGSTLFTGKDFVSAWFLETAKLVKARIDPNVILAFIANTPGTFNLSPDLIIYLTNSGASKELINAMMEHDQLIASGQMPVTASQVPMTMPLLTIPLARTAPAAPTMPAPVTPASPTSGAQLTHPTPPSLTSEPANSPVSAFAANIPESIVVPNEPAEPDWAVLLAEIPEAPEQPASRYPVRLPYPVKLTDPIVVFHYRGY
jgi:hypothetical protein